jgi:TM2 domain-containing membrane protein YozV
LQNVAPDEAAEDQAMSSSMPDPQSLPPLPPPGLAPPPPPPKSPPLALFLSLFPGLGQLYNGQVAKAFTFFFAFVGSIYGAAEIAALPFGLLIPFTYFYNLVDAYRSATLINLRAQGGQAPLEEEAGESPAWGAVLLGIGLLILFNNLGWINLVALERFWPVLLIAAGAFFLYRSVQQKKSTASRPEERFRDRID